MAERVDVCIVGSGLRRLDLRLPARRALPRGRADARACWCSSAGRRHQHTDFRQSMDLEHLSRIYGLVQGQGAQIVVGDGVGGGSNLYLAASLRSPTRDVRAPRPPSRRRPGPAHVAEPDQPRDARPLLRAGRGGAARAAPDLEAGREVGRAVGQDARQRRPHVRPRAARDRPQPLHPGEVVPHRLHLRREELGHHELPRRRPSRSGVAGAPQLAGGADRAERRAPLPLPPDRLRDRQRRRRPDPPAHRRRVPDRVQGADPVRGRDGQLAAADALAPGAAEPVVAARQAPRHQRRPHRGGRVRRAEGARRARAARLRPDLQGQPHLDDDVRLLDGQARATPATASASRCRRSTSRRSRTRSTTTGATQPASRPASGLQKKAALSTFNNHIELLAMVEDTHDGEFLAPPPFGSHVRPNAGPLGVGPFTYELSEQSVRVREAADAAIRERGRAQRPGPVHEAHLPRRVRVASAGRLPDGRLEGPRRRRPPQRGVRQRGPVLHRLLGDPDVAGREPVADDLGRVRARGRAADRPRGRLRPARQAGRLRARACRACSSARTPRRCGSSSDAAIDAKVRSYG